MPNPEPLTLELLQQAVTNAAAVRCRRRLQPAGGPGDKVFPPTYAGAVYAVEQRRLPGRPEPVTCVLLDSVQSQANRMELALQEAVDAGLIKLPLVVVDFTPWSSDGEKPENERLRDAVGKITSLQVPHRLADAILRDSQMEEDDQQGNKKQVPFRESAIGKRLNEANPQNATPLFELCPTALVFGVWDSTGPKGGLGAKFERAMVSEIVGVGVSFGIKTASRIDPIITSTKGITLYLGAAGHWTLDEQSALRELSDSLKKKLDPPTAAKEARFVALAEKDGQKCAHYFDENYRKVAEQELSAQVSIEALEGAKAATFRDGKVSSANLGNVTPDLDRYDARAITADNRMTPDPMRSDGGFIEGKRIRPGGVTIEYAEQITTLSLIVLRRLRFPINGQTKLEVEIAARTVLAALGLCAATLAFEKGAGLRSRCLLWPEEPMTWELLARPGEEPRRFTLTAEDAVSLLNSAAEETTKVGLPWNTKPVVLQPQPELVDLVRSSQELAIKSGPE